MGFHASEALMIHGGDKDDAFWHKMHVKRLTDYKKGMDNAEKAEQDGTPCDMNISLVRYAQIYNVCFPFNTETIYKGWYDEYTLVKVYAFVCIFIDSSLVSHDYSLLD